MTQKLVKAIGKDYQRSCLYQLIAVAIVVPLFVVCILLPLYFANRPGVSETEFLLITIIPAALFLVVLFGGGFGFLFWSIRRRASWLDEIFISLGLKGKSYTFTGRQYHGKVRGRNVDVLFTRGPSLSIYISTDVFTSLTISDPVDVSQNIAKVLHKTPLDTHSKDLTFFAKDEVWGKQLANDPEAHQLLKELIFDEHPYHIRHVLFEPGFILLRLYRSQKMFDFKIPPEQGKRWVDKLLHLAEIAEGFEPPQVEMATSSVSTSIREGKATKIGWIVAAVILIMTGCVALIAVGTIFLLEGGF
jgi:hypothetical protein